ncbi:Hypothetical protein D9617_8g051890 [Elsinoe fawcettii]|nr:Hypothetical protein D9617_8g051890 [Elsinoe fawcettii]
MPRIRAFFRRIKQALSRRRHREGAGPQPLLHPSVPIIPFAGEIEDDEPQPVGITGAMAEQMGVHSLLVMVPSRVMPFLEADPRLTFDHVPTEKSSSSNMSIPARKADHSV